MYITLQQDSKGRYYELTDEGLKQTPLTLGCTTQMAVDMTDADFFRKKLGTDNKIHVSINSLVIKAAANALEDFPMLSGFWEGKDKVRCPNPGDMNITGSIRVENALGNFTIKKASRKTLLEISKELDAQINQVRSNKQPFKLPLLPYFITTNIGTLGPAEAFDMSGITFEPSVAGMGICAMLEKPWVKNGQIQIRNIMNFILFWNHRAMNADIPLAFQTECKKFLEEPFTYLM